MSITMMFIAQKSTASFRTLMPQVAVANTVTKRI